jgi:sirohydrochlorin ferrochelatase
MKCKVIPVLIGATGIVTKRLKAHLEARAGKHSTDPIQKTAVLGTSHIIRKLLQFET